jgi:hypothetical protein
MIRKFGPKIKKGFLTDLSRQDPEGRRTKDNDVCVSWRFGGLCLLLIEIPIPTMLFQLSKEPFAEQASI